jgi:hypothetical protein
VPELPVVSCAPVPGLQARSGSRLRVRGGAAPQLHHLHVSLFRNELRQRAREGVTLATRPLPVAAPSNGRIQQLWRLPLDTLSPGEHVLRVTIAGSQGRQVREVTVMVVD